MPVKILNVEGLGPVHFYKKRGMRSIRLSFTVENNIRVSLPLWVPYREALSFVSDKREWILKHRPTSDSLLTDGMPVGSDHILRLVRTADVAEISSQTLGRTILVEFPPQLVADDSKVQASARKAAHRALRKEAEISLPLRTRALAETHNFKVRSISVRQLKRRWGSCDSKGNITFNFFLMQMPDKLIDYVILHELTHTKQMHHQKAFWETLASVLPEYKDLRKQLKDYKPAVMPAGERPETTD